MFYWSVKIQEEVSGVLVYRFVLKTNIGIRKYINGMTGFVSLGKKRLLYMFASTKEMSRSCVKRVYQNIKKFPNIRNVFISNNKRVKGDGYSSIMYELNVL